MKYPYPHSFVYPALRGCLLVPLLSGLREQKSQIAKIKTFTPPEASHLGGFRMTELRQPGKHRYLTAHYRQPGLANIFSPMALRTHSGFPEAAFSGLHPNIKFSKSDYTPIDSLPTVVTLEVRNLTSGLFTRPDFIGTPRIKKPLNLSRVIKRLLYKLYDCLIGFSLYTRHIRKVIIYAGCAGCILLNQRNLSSKKFRFQK